MKLNGWQRLWVCISVLYWVLVFWLGLALTASSFPTKELIQREWADELIGAIKSPERYVYQIRDAYSDMTNKDLITAITKKIEAGEATSRIQSNSSTHSPKVRFLDKPIAITPEEGLEFKERLQKEIQRREKLKERVRDVNKRNKKKENDLLKTQIGYVVKSIFTLLLWAIIPPALLYAFGLAMEWVVNGFKRQAN